MLTEIINSSLKQQLIVLIIAALPIVELRGAIPVAMDIFHMPWYQSLILSLIGNLIPVPLLLLFYDVLTRTLSRLKIGKIFIEWLSQRSTRQARIIEKYGHIGIILFTAIPFPGTGAWTASIVTHFLGIRFKNALLDIMIGVIGAGVIVTILVLLGWIGAGIAGVSIIALAIVHFQRRQLQRRQH
ncbi:COG2426 family protein [Chloroflexota bacterium]